MKRAAAFVIIGLPGGLNGNCRRYAAIEMVLYLTGIIKGFAGLTEEREHGYFKKKTSDRDTDI